MLTAADAPQAMKLLLNDAGTYDRASGTGGCDGSIVLFPCAAPRRAAALHRPQHCRWDCSCGVQPVGLRPGGGCSGSVGSRCQGSSAPPPAARSWTAPRTAT